MQLRSLFSAHAAREASRGDACTASLYAVGLVLVLAGAALIAGALAWLSDGWQAGAAAVAAGVVAIVIGLDAIADRSLPYDKPATGA